MKNIVNSHFSALVYRTMFKHRVCGFFVLLVAVLFGLVGYNYNARTNRTLIESYYIDPLPVLQMPAAVFHIGHSLVGRDMPAMLGQLAGDGHQYRSQLGWGTSLREHWEPDLKINGSDVENSHSSFREARDAVSSGDYNILVLTESVEIRDAIKYGESWRYLALWANAARTANSNVRVFLYETWHQTDDAEGWENRVERDLERYWERKILDRAMLSDNSIGPIYVIPAGQVIAEFLREARSGDLSEVSGPEYLFADKIHFNEIGAYLVALTHYSVIFGKSPIGLPHELKLYNGEPASAPSDKAARLMQEVVWKVVTSYKRTGVSSKKN